jgi:hypothetical protein
MALIQRGWRETLSKFGAMGETLKAFIAENNKKCDGCGFCVQRNRDALKPSAMEVEYADGQLALCPLFPQYAYVFERLDAEKVAGVIECLRFMENSLPPQKEEKREDNLRMFRL